MTEKAANKDFRVRSPKLLPRRTEFSLSTQYYAGFNEGFVEDVITRLDLTKKHIILDPWNGSGTTTLVASRRGIQSFGLDINPVLVLMGKAKLLGPDVTESLHALTTRILIDVPDVLARQVNEPDPLGQWFTEPTVDRIRRLEAAIQRVLVDPDSSIDLSQPANLKKISSLAASFYAVLFTTLRSFLKEYATSNPTWIKSGVKKDLVRVTQRQLLDRFQRYEKAHHRRLDALETTDNEIAEITVGDSSCMPFGENTFDSAIGSPPYCTRIDYPILTRPELAVLGIGEHHMRSLRDTSIGTTTMYGTGLEVLPEWGLYVKSLMARITNHPSKASKTYYRKYYLQYFNGMHGSIKELRRVTKPGGTCALVVQDSYYKELRVDLARALTEMAEQCGFKSERSVSFSAPHRIANMNPRSHRYMAKSPATESLLVFR
jgi:DNA modification methylase